MLPSEVTAEPTVQAESTSAISVTAVSSEVALPRANGCKALSKQVHHNSEGEAAHEKRTKTRCA